MPKNNYCFLQLQNMRGSFELKQTTFLAMTTVAPIAFSGPNRRDFPNPNVAECIRQARRSLPVLAVRALQLSRFLDRGRRVLFLLRSAQSRSVAEFGSSFCLASSSRYESTTGPNVPCAGNVRDVPSSVRDCARRRFDIRDAFFSPGPSADFYV